MTMFPAAAALNLYSSSSSSTRTLNIVSSCDEDQDCNISKLSGCNSNHMNGTLKGYLVVVGSEQLAYEMGDDEDQDSRLTQTTGSSNIKVNYQGGGGVSSKEFKQESDKRDEDEDEEEEGGWLQLSIGGHRGSTNAAAAASAAATVTNVKSLDQLGARTNTCIGANDYYPPPSQDQQYKTMIAPPVFQFQHYFYPQQNHHTATNTNYWHPSPTSGYILPPRTAHDAGPSFDFRVIDPPCRPHSGLWFMLKASQSQAKEPFLPQIPKSYLRIRDGRMTVGLVIKYIINKLRLDSESEIEIRCRGEQLVPVLTLQDVRDNVWNNKSSNNSNISSGGGRFITPPSTSTHHLMLLHYGWNTTTTIL